MQLKMAAYDVIKKYCQQLNTYLVYVLDHRSVAVFNLVLLSTDSKPFNKTLSLMVKWTSIVQLDPPSGTVVIPMCSKWD